MTKGRPSSGSRRQRTAAQEADFRRACDEAKARHDLSDILESYTTLKKRGGREMKGLCPFHKERTPSFEVNNAKGTFHCHGCGISGDHFTALTKLGGLTFRQAYEALAGDTFPTVAPEQRAQRAAEDEAERQSAIDEARTFWAAAIDPYGTPAETYLRRARGITRNIPPSMRFGMVSAGKNDAGEWGPAMPALIGAVTLLDELVAIQRIFLRNDGTDKRWGKPRKSKLTLGRYRGGAIKMGNRKPDPTEIVITEGPEDALSLAQELPVEVWAVLGTANMALLEFPETVTTVVIAGQNDDAGRVAVEAAALALVERGYAVRTMWPDPRFKDWNDQLRGVAR